MLNLLAMRLSKVLTIRFSMAHLKNDRAPWECHILMFIILSIINPKSQIINKNLCLEENQKLKKIN
jgi:hypothetical protein